MAISPISECEVEDGELDLYTYLTGDAGDLEMLKDPNNEKGLKFRYEGMQVGYNATAYHIATFANNPAKQNGDPYGLKFSIWQESVTGCVHTYERNVKVLPRPKAFAITSSAVIACNEDTAFMTASNNDVVGLTYRWSVDGVVKNGVTGALLAKSALHDGYNTVGVTAVNANGCATASVNKITIKLAGFNPAVRFKETLSYCQNSGVFTLADIIEGDDKQQMLDRTGGYTHKVTSTPTGLFAESVTGVYSVSPSQKAAGDYLVRLSMDNGECEVYRTATLTILPVPAAFTVVASTTDVVCNSDDVTITATNKDMSGLTYQWYVNNAPVPNVTGASLAKDYLAQGNNTVYAIATNGSGCSVRSSNTATVTLHTLAPEVDFTTSEYSYCANAGKFSLHGLLTGGDKEKVLGRQDGMNYEFTHSPTGLSIDNTFDNDEVDPAQSTPGMYTVTLRIQRNGCEVKRTATLTILPIPETFSVAASTTNVVCNDEAVMITASNNGVAGLNYQWYVNNALVSGVTGANLAKSYLAQGSNAVYAITTNNSGCAVRSDNTTTVTLHTLAPEVAFTTSEYSYCANAGKFSLHGLLTGGDKEKVLGRQDNMAYDFASSPSGLSIDNTFGDYRVDPAQSTPQAYIVTLWVRRSGCEISRTTTLTINVVPSNFNITTTKPSTVIDGKTIYLLCNSSSFDAATTALANTASVEWYLGTTKITTTTAGSYAYTIGSDQRAQVSAIAISDKGCQVNSNNVLTVDRRTVDFSGVVVNTSSTAYCNSDDNINYFTFVTAGNKSDIEGSTNGWGYTLNSGGINQCGGDNNTKMLCLQNSTPGTYKTVFTVTKNSCVATWDKTITIKPVPGGTTLTPDVSNLCASGTATLTATTQGYVNSYTYNWYKDNALVRSGYTDRTHNYTAEGGVTQTKWKVAAVDNGCTGAISNEVTVNNNQPTMEAAFVKSSFTSDEGLQIKLLSMVNVDVNSIAFTVTQQSNGSTQTFTPTPTNNVYLIKFSGNISVRRYTIEVSFKDDKGGACSNSITIGEIDKSSSTSYTVVSGNTLPAQQSQQSSSTSTRTVTPKVADATTAGDYDDEAERLYREYVAGLRNDEHKAFLAPTYTGSAEDVKLLIYSQQPEQVTIKVYSSTGNLIVTKPLSLYGGITEYRLSGREKPQTIGMYYVMIEYANGARETLKGVVK
jgi:hypothetical protein